MCPGVTGDGNARPRSAPGRVSVWRRISPAQNESSAGAGMAGGSGRMRNALPRPVVPRVSVWQRISPAHGAANAAALQRSSPAGAAGGDGGTRETGERQTQNQGPRAGHSRRRRRPRFWQRPAPVSGPQPGSALPEASCDAVKPPPCIIDWSDQVASAVEDLARAVTVTVIGDEPLASADEVAAVLAARIDVVASSLVLRRASPSSYLLFLPDLALVDRLVGLQQLVSWSTYNFSLLCKRWSRLSGARGCVLPFLIDIELRGIPAHVWETSTVDRFLSPHAWVQQVHPDTLGLVDLSCFRCLAWCSDPSALPSTKELWVVEPPTSVVENPPVMRVLAYPIKLQFSDALRPGGLDPSPPPSDGGDEDDNDSARRRRRVRFPSSPPSSGPMGGGTSGHDGLLLETVQGMSHVGRSGSQLLAAAAKEAAEVHVSPGVDRPTPAVVSRAREEVSVPDELAAEIDEVAARSPEDVAGGSSNIDVVRTHDEFPSRLNVGRGPISLDGAFGPVLDHFEFDVPNGLGCFSQLEAANVKNFGPSMGEATVWISPGQPVGACSGVSPPTDLATDGALSPASPCLPQRSPVASPPELLSPPPANGPVASPATFPAPEDGAAPGHADFFPALGTPHTPAPGSSRGPVEEPGCVLLPSGMVAGFPQVYSRKRFRSRAARSVLDASTPAEAPLASPLHRLNKVSKPINALLPQPVIHKRRAKGPPIRSLPRRSRRVAGASPCSPGPVVSAAQKRIMKSLGFGTDEKIDPADQDKYSKLFGRLLSESNVAALAAIFGWTVGEGEQVRSTDLTFGF